MRLESNMLYHKTKEGTKIAFCDLTDDHLKNIIKLYERRATKGVDVIITKRFHYNPDKDDFEPTQFRDIYYDEKALEVLRYYDYADEFIRRGLK